MAATDQLLVQRTLDGDRDAFADLVDRYAGLVHGAIALRVHRPDEVEDLVQDVFCKAFQELPRLREPARFASWLGRIATNRAQAWLRQRQAHKTSTTADVDALGLESGESPEAGYDDREAHAALWRAMDRLRPELRQVVVLFHFEDCPQRDIARFLGISVATVKWRLMRARQKLRRELEDLLPAGAEPGLAQRDQRQRLRRGILAALPAAALVRPRGAVASAGLLAGRGWLALAGGLCAAGALLVAGGSGSPAREGDGQVALRVELAAAASAGAADGDAQANPAPALPPCASGKLTAP